MARISGVAELFLGHTDNNMQDEDDKRSISTTMGFPKKSFEERDERFNEI